MTSGDDGWKQDESDGATTSGLDKDAFLGGLRRMGWRSAYLDDGKTLEHMLDGGDVATALMHSWRREPTLENFARLLNGASAIFTDDNRLRRFVSAMNLGYIQAQSNLPETLRDSYVELLFWDGCDMPEARSYFERVGARFAEQSAEQGAVGPELRDMLQSRDLSPQMKEVRRIAVDKLRETLRGQLAMERVPAERLRTVLDMAIGVGGARIVNDTIWEMARQSVQQGAQASPDAYLTLRDMLTQAAEGPMLDQPRETLNRITSIIEELDNEAQFGLPFDASRMLQYWRGMGFRDIPDARLLALYEKYLRANPSGLSLLQQDRAMLKDREDEALHALLNGKRQTAHDETERRNDGFSERDTKRGSFFDRRMIMYIGLGVLVVALMAALALMLRNREPAEENSTSIPTLSPEPTEVSEPEPTLKPIADPEDDFDTGETDMPAPTSDPTPDVTLEPTPTTSLEPTPSPTAASTPTPTPRPTNRPTNAPTVAPTAPPTAPPTTQPVAPAPTANVSTQPPAQEEEIPEEEPPINEETELTSYVDAPADSAPMGDGVIE